MKKLLCLLLAGLMLASTVACAKPDETPDDETKATTTASADVETEDPAYSLGLPSNLHYDNSKVSILYPEETNFVSEIFSDKLGRGIVSDAVYERNVAVEDRLGVKMEYNEQSDVIASLTKDIQSGLGDYHLVSNYTYTTVPSIVEGKFLNLSTLENLDMDKNYWSDGFSSLVTFTDDDMQFLATGALSLSLYRLTYVTLYNKNLFKEYQISDLYDTVMNGEWTLDKQYAISKDHYVDSDHNGAVSSGDFYGFVTGNCVSVDPYMVATETYLVIRESDTGELAYNTAANARLVEVCDKLQLLYNDASTYAYDGPDHDNTNTKDVISHFAKERALMATTLFAQMETNYSDLAALSYGIAPMPKFDTNQKNYGSYVQDQVTSFGISSVVGDPARQEMCAAVLEAMAYYSNRLLRPAYYDTALSERYMQDPESKEILDLIFDTVYFDFSSTCANMLPVITRDSLRTLLTDTSNTIASSTKTWEKLIKNSIRSINRKLQTVAENQNQ